MKKQTLVVDVDDTICITDASRDYANSRPIPEMITKLNSLYDQGFQIIYHTARGMLSKKGNMARIETEVRDVLEDWMNRHNVKYHELKMGKPFGYLYIDDKAMTPDVFLQTSFTELRTDGRSGASLTKVGNKVIKECVNVVEQTDWYEAAQLIYPESMIPKVYDVSPTNYRMEFIEGKAGWESLSPSVLRDLTTILQIERSTQPLDDYDGSFDTYYDRATRLVPSGLTVYGKDYTPEASFCHGDLTLDNVIVRPNQEIAIIDPSIYKGVWSSWLIDYGRLLQSYRSRYEVLYKNAPDSPWYETCYQRLVQSMGSHEDGLFHEYLIWCRVYSNWKQQGRPDAERILVQIENTIKEYENVRKQANTW